MNTDVIWSNLLSQLKDKLTSLSYDTWFKETKLHKLGNGKAQIIVPMPIHKKHLMDSYSDLITSKLYEITNSEYELSFLLIEEIEEEEKEEARVEQITTNNINNTMKVNTNLIKDYEFENFIVGNSNKFAHAAALSVAEHPGTMYNPLFLYGDSGLGKTHLMHAIGNYITKNSNKKVLYVTSEQFIEEFVKSTRKDDNEQNFNYVEFFKNKYRSIDVLIIDDIQFLGGAQQSQQEFFHTFNNLFNDNKQIIIASDRSPTDLSKLEDRLKTRFSWGLTVNIYPPEFALRTEILRKKIVAGNFEQDIPDDVIEYIASNIGPDVRQLEGSITRLLAYSAIMGGEKITLDLAIDALKDFISKGIGEKKAKNIVDVLGKDTLKIILENPENLLLIPSISKQNVDTLHNKLKEYEASYETILYLGNLGFSTKDSMIVYNHYKDKTKQIIEDDIYKLIYDIIDINFKKIDQIAINMGIQKDDIIRVKAALIYIMTEVSNTYGHSYYYKEELVSLLPRVLGVEISQTEFEHAIEELIFDVKIVVKEEKYYLKDMYDSEILIVKRLRLLEKNPITTNKHIEDKITD